MRFSECKILHLEKPHTSIQAEQQLWREAPEGYGKYQLQYQPAVHLHHK